MLLMLLLLLLLLLVYNYAEMLACTTVIVKRSRNQVVLVTNKGTELPVHPSAMLQIRRRLEMAACMTDLQVPKHETSWF